MIENNIKVLREKIKEICKTKNKSWQNIKIVAVSKFHSTDSIKEAYASGIKEFGENYIQEWVEKKEALIDYNDIIWHIIGHLQKNKIKFLNDNRVSICLQTLDSFSLALELEKKLDRNKPLPVLIQIRSDRTSKEKTGCTFEEAQKIIAFLLTSKKMDWLGFMTIGANTDSSEDIVDLFKSFYTQSMDLWESNHKKSKPILSFGMSGDLELAIACGSNMIRVGSLVFGKRGKF